MWQSIKGKSLQFIFSLGLLFIAAPFSVTDIHASPANWPQSWEKLRAMCSGLNLRMTLFNQGTLKKLKEAIEKSEWSNAADQFFDLSVYLEQGLAIDIVRSQEINWRKLFEMSKTALQSDDRTAQIEAMRVLYSLSIVLAGEKIDDTSRFLDVTRVWGSPPQPDVRTPVDDRPDEFLVLAAEVEAFYTRYVEDSFVPVESIEAEIKAAKGLLAPIRLGDLKALIDSLIRVKVSDSPEWDSFQTRLKSHKKLVSRLIDQTTQMEAQLAEVEKRIVNGVAYLPKEGAERRHAAALALADSSLELGQSIKLITSEIRSGIEFLEEELSPEESDRLMGQLKSYLENVRTNWRVSLIANVKDARVDDLRRLLRHNGLSKDEIAELRDPDEKSLIQLAPNDEIRSILDQFFSEAD